LLAADWMGMQDGCILRDVASLLRRSCLFLPLVMRGHGSECLYCGRAESDPGVGTLCHAPLCPVQLDGVLGATARELKEADE
jgi:hypothetical protein